MSAHKNRQGWTLKRRTESRNYILCLFRVLKWTGYISWAHMKPLHTREWIWKHEDNKGIGLAGGPGFEPRITESESCFLIFKIKWL